MEVGVSITLAQLLVTVRDSRVADAVLVDARKKLALLKAGSRAEDISEAKARRDTVAARLDEGRAKLDQCSGSGHDHDGWVSWERFLLGLVQSIHRSLFL